MLKYLAKREVINKKTTSRSKMWGWPKIYLKTVLFFIRVPPNIFLSNEALRKQSIFKIVAKLAGKKNYVKVFFLCIAFLWVFNIVKVIFMLFCINDSLFLLTYSRGMIPRFSDNFKGLMEHWPKMGESCIFDKVVLNIGIIIGIVWKSR